MRTTNLNIKSVKLIIHYVLRFIKEFDIDVLCLYYKGLNINALKVKDDRK